MKIVIKQMKTKRPGLELKQTNIVHQFVCLIIIQAAFFIISFRSVAQGLHKAYERVSYSGIINGQGARFILANGYIGASSLKLNIPGHHKLIVFEPDQGVGDEKSRLKFVPGLKGRLDYFVMDNMQDSYDENPVYFNGKYYLNHRVIPVKFRLIRH